MKSMSLAVISGKFWIDPGFLSDAGFQHSAPYLKLSITETPVLQGSAKNVFKERTQINRGAKVLRYAKAMTLIATVAANVAKKGTVESPAANWWVYIIQCDDGSLYTGVSTDPLRRFEEHRLHPLGAKYFNGRQPVAIVYTESGHTRSTACQREAAIKKLKRVDKLALLAASVEGKSD